MGDARNLTPRQWEIVIDKQDKALKRLLAAHRAWVKTDELMLSERMCDALGTLQRLDGWRWAKGGKPGYERIPAAKHRKV